MSDNDVYLVKLQVRFSPTKENRVNETKISSKSDRRFLARSVQVEIMMKNSRYCMFSLLRFVFFFLWGQIASHNILFLRTKSSEIAKAKAS